MGKQVLSLTEQLLIFTLYVCVYRTHSVILARMHVIFVISTNYIMSSVVICNNTNHLIINYIITKLKIWSFIVFSPNNIHLLLHINLKFQWGVATQGLVVIACTKLRFKKKTV